MHLKPATYLWASVLLAVGLMLSGCPTKAAGAKHGVEPSEIRFDAQTDHQTVTIAATDLGIAQIEPSAAWLKVAPETVLLLPLVTSGVAVDVSIDRSHLLPFENEGAITVQTPTGETVKIPVYVDAHLVANYAPDSTSITAGKAVVFHNQSWTTELGGAIKAWAWDFGDGSRSADRHPVHIFDTPGSYRTSLTVHAEHKNATYAYPSPIDVAWPDPPVAAFIVSSATPLAGSVVQFQDLTVPGSSPVTGWLWEFGDGKVSVDRNPTHAYAAPGVYDVRLTVSTSDGTDTYTKLGAVEVQVLPPTSGFTNAPSTPKAGEPVQFVEQVVAGTYEIDAWYWDFGDGATADSPLPTHTYAEPGAYDVTLIVTSGDHESAFTQTVTVVN